MVNPKKVHTTALCWVPAVESQPPIQALRLAHDRQIDRWPPHVNVLYPFVPEAEFEAAAGRLEAALRPLPAFGVTLSRLDRFVHGRRGLTAWLAPEPDHASSDGDDPWRALQALCQQAFPHCADQTSRGGRFTAHLTVGQFERAAEVDALQAEVMRGWVAPRCAVDELVLISRAAQDAPFLVHWRVPLGGGAARREAAPLQRGVWLPTRLPTPRAATTLTATATATATAAAQTSA